MRARTLVATASMILAALAVAPASASDALQPGCHVRDQEFEGPFGTNRVEVEHNCRTTVTLNEGILCLGGSVGKTEVEVGSVTLVYYHCENPNQGGSGLDGLVVATSAAQPCREFFGTSVLVQVETYEDCSAGVHLVDAYRVCRNLAGFHSDRVWATAGPLTASVGSCFPDFVAVAAAGPSLDCTPSHKTYGVATVVVEADCDRRVDVKFMDCVWNGSWKTVGAGPVTVRVYSCDGASTDSTSDAGGRDVYLPKTSCERPAVGYYERVVDTEVVDVYAWRCTIA